MVFRSWPRNTVVVAGALLVRLAGGIGPPVDQSGMGEGRTFGYVLGVSRMPLVPVDKRREFVLDVLAPLASRVSAR